MGFSKVFYHSYAGSRVKAEQSSFLAVNPVKEPGSILFIGSCAERAAIGGQVASKLALQHFLIGAQDSLATSMDNTARATEVSLAALEAAFRTANSAVYEFGHKLSAGGRMAASLTAVFIREGLIAAGRVGKGVAYLSRNGEIFPFFSERPQEQDAPSIGSNSIVAVELASVPAEAGDIVIVFSDPIPIEEESELGYSVSLLLPKFDQLESVIQANLEGQIAPVARQLDRLDSKCCERLTRQVFGDKGPAFCSILAIGPEVTFLEPMDSVEQAAA